MATLSSWVYNHRRRAKETNREELPPGEEYWIGMSTTYKPILERKPTSPFGVTFEECAIFIGIQTSPSMLIVTYC